MLISWRLTVRENLTVYAKLYGVENVRDRIMQVSEEFRLGNLLDRRVRKLSSGQKTRVSLAKSMINRPEFLLLDEPTASLDPDTTLWIREFLNKYRENEGATILFASHDMREVELLCDEVLLMKKENLSSKVLRLNYYSGMIEVIWKRYSWRFPRKRNCELEFQKVDRTRKSIGFTIPLSARSSWPRIIEIAYWPTMQMIIWGFVSQHFSSSSPELTAGGILISVVLVWDCLSVHTLVTRFLFWKNYGPEIWVIYLSHPLDRWS